MHKNGPIPSSFKIIKEGANFPGGKSTDLNNYPPLNSSLIILNISKYFVEANN